MALSYMSGLDDGVSIYSTFLESLIQSLRGRYVKTGCKVSANSSTLSVDVADGVVVYEGQEYNVTATNLSLEAALSDKDRADVVVWDYNNGSPELKVITGTRWITLSDGSKVPITDRISDSQIPLAVVIVRANATLVNANDVIDVRSGIDGISKFNGIRVSDKVGIGILNGLSSKLHIYSGENDGIMVESSGDHPLIKLKGFDGTKNWTLTIQGGWYGRALELLFPTSGYYIWVIPPNATSTNTIVNPALLKWSGKYWDGSQSNEFDFKVIPEILDTTPTARLRFNLSNVGDILVLHSSDGIIAGKSVNPSGDNSLNLGSSSLRWSYIYGVNAGYHDGTDIVAGWINRSVRSGHDFVMARTVAGDYTWKRALVPFPDTLVINYEGDFSNGVRVDSKFYPNLDNGLDLGLVTNRWANIYAVNGKFDGLLRGNWSNTETIYVSPTGGGDGSSSDSPTTLDNALTRAKSRVCAIALADGEYHISKDYVLACDYISIYSQSGDNSKVTIVFDSYNDGSFNYSYSIEVQNGFVLFNNVTLQNADKSDANLPWAISGGGGTCIVLGNGGFRNGVVAFRDCVINQTRPWFISTKHSCSGVILVSTTVNMSGDAQQLVCTDFGTCRFAVWNSTITSGYKWCKGYLGYDFITNWKDLSSVGGTYHWVPASDNVYSLGSSTQRWANIYAVNGYVSSNIDVGGVVRVKTKGYSVRETSTGEAFKVLHSAGPASDFIISLQDGSGRIQFYWNCTPGSSTQKFIVGGENAGKWEFDVSAPNTDLFKILYADGSNANAGDTITWDNILQCGLAGLKIFKSGVYPGSDNALSLGSSSLRWANIYGVNIHNCDSINFDNNSNSYLKIYYSTDSNGHPLLNIGGGFNTDTSSTEAYMVFSPVDTMLSAFSIQPLIDNTYSLGTSTKRWANLYVVNLNTGDIILDNKWRISEYDDNCKLLNGIRVLNSSGEEIFRITEDGVWFKGKQIV